MLSKAVIRAAYVPLVGQNAVRTILTQRPFTTTSSIKFARTHAPTPPTPSFTPITVPAAASTSTLTPMTQSSQQEDAKHKKQATILAAGALIGLFTYGLTQLDESDELHQRIGAQLKELRSILFSLTGTETVECAPAALNPEVAQLAFKANPIVGDDDNYPIASWTRRFFAWLIDLTLGQVLDLSAVVLVGLIAGQPFDAALSIALSPNAFSIGEFVLNVLSCFLWDTFWGLASSTGQTPGQRLLGIKTIHSDGTPLDRETVLKSAVVRSLIPVPINFSLPYILPERWTRKLPFMGGARQVAENKLQIHNIVADTIVVDTRKIEEEDD